MLVHVLCVLLAGVPVCLGVAYSDYYDADGVDEEADSYNNYNEEIQAPTMMATVMDAVTRMKKRELGNIRTLDPVENFDVKGALFNILRKTTPESSQELQAVVRENSNSYDYIENSNAIRKEKPVNRDGSNGNILYKKWLPSLRVQNWSPSDETQANVADYSSQTDQRWINVYQTDASTYLRKNDIIDQIRKFTPVFDGDVAAEQPVYHSYDIQTSSNDVQSLHPTDVIQTLTTTDGSDTTQYNTMVYQHTSTYSNSEVNKLVPHWNLSSIVHRRSLPNNVQHWSTTNDVPLWNLSDNILHRKPPGQAQHWGTANDVPLWNLSDNILQRKPPGQAQHWGPAIYVPLWNISENILRRMPPGQAQHWGAIDVHHRRHPSNVKHHTPPSRVQHWSSSNNVQRQSSTTAYTRTGYKSLALRDDPKESTTNITTTRKPQVQIDLDHIINILRNLTDDYEWNITDYFNKSLIDNGYQTCDEKLMATQTTEEETTPSGYDFEGAALVSKCFVCGLKTPEIPRNAHCSDAFAGDFLPLMPVNPQSRAKIATYRKYCRHLDSSNYIENENDTRAIYGRFTGGCAVRWTDLTGVYTQRTCRSKYRPLMGQHFASKRMARLELALVNVADGCIISPMATLLPVSRGISLYARFHACVCSTNWCNKAARAHSSLYRTIVFVLACWLAHYT